ncbi:probable galacturonosyltransferase 4 isoform X3 [Ananas comosus]|uniref:Probable galacturonosyltransferase 4 isoform X3 n=1 Tax=Ananas comosus TaxID=4615 RepID=A0A6P5F8A8_ANACO|nr:probable galacturonosyltransferase 4 isoform X3 [Ananas comosus]XP_020092421.1 probable galacturonosyltransferase 4 isoform X3 [Ananas comosus]
MGRRKKTMLVLLCASVLAPLLLYTDRLSTLHAADPIQTQLRNSGEHKSKVLSEAPEKKTPPPPDIGGVILQVTTKEENKSEVKLETTSTKIVPGNNHPVSSNKNSGNSEIPDSRIRHIKDQLIRAKVYLSLAATRTNAHFIRELRARIKDMQRTLGDATKDSELLRNYNTSLNTISWEKGVAYWEVGTCI